MLVAPGVPFAPGANVSQIASSARHCLGVNSTVRDPNRAPAPRL